MAWLQSASAMKRILRQVRRDASCRRMRSNFCLISAGFGVTCGIGIFRAPTRCDCHFDLFLVALVESDRAVYLPQRQRVG